MIECIHDPESVQVAFQDDPFLHLYELGDLDDPYWASTTWYRHAQHPGVIALMYSGLAVPSLLLLTRPNATDSAKPLLEGLAPLLPRRFYAHLGVGLGVHVEASGWTGHPRGRYMKMGLNRDRIPNALRDAGAAVVRPEDWDSALAFYDRAYPGHFFEQSHLQSGLYLGLRAGDSWQAIAGIHVFSQVQRLAALGNVAVAPEARGQGLGRRITAALCDRLRAEGAETIGLNVHADNAAAIRCYESLGFEGVSPYEEWYFESA